jgi:hypothetical protein
MEDLMAQFVSRSTTTCAVLGKGSEFILCYLDAQQVLSDVDRELANARGYRFCGLVGLQNGRVEIAVEPFPEAQVLVLIAALRFAENLRVPKTAHDDSLKWLEDLHKLEDDRLN